MRALYRHSGQRTALAVYGVKLGSLGSDVLRELKLQALGHPEKVWKQLKNDELLHPRKGVLYHALPKTIGEVGSAMAWPIFGSYLLSRGNPQVGLGEVAGDLTARTLGSMLGQPLLGAVGQLGGGMLLAPVGRAIGKQFDRKKEQEPDAVAS